jgi:hypothetical protein
MQNPLTTKNIATPTHPKVAGIKNINGVETLKSRNQ